MAVYLARRWRERLAEASAGPQYFTDSDAGAR